MRDDLHQCIYPAFPLSYFLKFNMAKNSKMTTKMIKIGMA